MAVEDTWKPLYKKKRKRLLISKTYLHLLQIGILKTPFKSLISIKVCLNSEVMYNYISLPIAKIHTL